MKHIILTRRLVYLHLFLWILAFFLYVFGVRWLCTWFGLHIFWVTVIPVFAMALDFYFSFGIPGVVKWFRPGVVRGFFYPVLCLFVGLEPLPFLMGEIEPEFLVTIEVAFNP